MSLSYKLTIGRKQAKDLRSFLKMFGSLRKSSTVRVFRNIIGNFRMTFGKLLDKSQNKKSSKFGRNVFTWLLTDMQFLVSYLTQYPV